MKLAALALSVLLAAPAYAQVAPKRVVVLFTDDLGAHQLRQYGNTVAITPGFDQLAALGKVYERAYAQVPLCLPSRVSFFWVLYPISPRLLTCPESDGVWNNTTSPLVYVQERKSWPQRLIEQDIPVYEFGKAFQTGNNDVTYIPWTYSYSPWPGTIEGNANVEDYDRLTVDEFLRVWATVQGDAVAFIGIHSPHEPGTTNPQFTSLYPATIPKPFVPAGDLNDVPVLATKGATGSVTTAGIANNYAAISKADYSLQRIMGAIDLSNTRLIVAADNGYLTGQHGKSGKDQMWDPATHIPLYEAGPGIAPGTRSANYVELIDIAPSIFKFFGLTQPAEFEGTPLDEPQDRAYTYKKGPTGFVDSTVHADVAGVPYRYTCWHGVNGGEELYDLAADPQEFTNQAGNPAFASIKADLISRMFPPNCDSH